MNIMLNRLSIKAKVMLLSVITILIAFVIGIVGIVGTLLVYDEYTYMGETADVRLTYSNELRRAFDEIRENTSLIVTFGAVYNDMTKVESYYDSAVSELSKIKEIIASYRENLNADDTVTQENKDRLNNDAQTVIDNLGDDYKALIDNLHERVGSDSVAQARDTFTSIGEKNNVVEETINDMVSAAVDKKALMQNDSQVMASTVWILIGVIALFGLLIGIVVAFIISKKIISPIKSLMVASEKVSNGDFNINIRSNGRDECSKLANDFSVVIDNVGNVISDIEQGIKKFGEGDLSVKLNEDKYNGEYKKLVIAVKRMMDDFIQQNRSIVQAVRAYGKGDFNYTAPRFPGDKAVVHETLDELKNNLSRVADAIRNTISDVADGKLDISLSDDSFEGDWAKIINGLNKVINAVSMPIKDMTSVLNSMSMADFSKLLNEGLYNGEFKIIAKTLNACCITLSGYVRETSEILESIAHQDISVSVSNNFEGDFLNIKKSLELLIESFNVLIKDIAASSEQVALGSKSIADSSLSLAQGATEQANAVEELNATVKNVAERTSHNAEKSTMASKLALEAQSNAAVVNKEMKEMLTAMDEINDASNNISNIIKAIDDIAFQTNILALNAAVEAARAGEHGKGFAVVADEVRTLASRSQQSAKETSDLIGTSLEKVEQGMSIANSTAEALRAIITQIGRISEISAEVADASEKQNEAIKEVNIGLSQISEVVSSNTATSEESAAASQELASQSTLFKETMHKFKLK